MIYYSRGREQASSAYTSPLSTGADSEVVKHENCTRDRVRLFGSARSFKSGIEISSLHESEFPRRHSSFVFVNPDSKSFVIRNALFSNILIKLHLNSWPAVFHAVFYKEKFPITSRQRTDTQGRH